MWDEGNWPWPNGRTPAVIRLACRPTAKRALIMNESDGYVEDEKKRKRGGEGKGKGKKKGKEEEEDGGVKRRRVSAEGKKAGPGGAGKARGRPKKTGPEAGKVQALAPGAATNGTTGRIIKVSLGASRACTVAASCLACRVVPKHFFSSSYANPSTKCSRLATCLRRTVPFTQAVLLTHTMLFTNPLLLKQTVLLT